MKSTLTETIRLLPFALLSACAQTPESQEIATEQVAFNEQAAAMLTTEGISAIPTHYPVGLGTPADTVLVSRNDYVTEGTYLPQPLVTDPPNPANEGKVLITPFGSSGILNVLGIDRCLIVDGKSETPVEVVENCSKKLR